jgi:hypothetical protein
MTDPKNDQRPDAGSQAAPDGAPSSQKAAKKPYRKPEIVSHSGLEVITGACSPQPPGKANLGSCGLVQS